MVKPAALSFLVVLDLVDAARILAHDARGVGRGVKVVSDTEDRTAKGAKVLMRMMK